MELATVHLRLPSQKSALRRQASSKNLLMARQDVFMCGRVTTNSLPPLWAVLSKIRELLLSVALRKGYKNVDALVVR